MGTLFSLLVAIFLLFSPMAQEVGPPMQVIALGMILLPVFFLILSTVITLMAWSPLQRAETKITPYLLDLYRQDRQFQLIDLWLIVYLLLSIVAAADLTLIHRIPTLWVLAGWTVGLGVTMDLTHHMLKRLRDYLNPFAIVPLFTKQAKRSIQTDDEQSLCKNIDALTEVATKATLRGSVSLCMESVNELEQTARHFLESTKTVAHHNEDKITYTLLYILQRLEMIFHQAFAHDLEPACSKVITALGKMTIHAANCDLSLAGMPLQALGKLAVEAECEGIHEVSDKAVCAVIEVSKVLVDEVDFSYGDVKSPFFALIAQLESITKEMFTQNKNIPLELLTQPFHDLKELLKSEKIAGKEDAPIIVAEVDRVLGDFAALEAVLRAIPSTEEKTPKPSTPESSDEEM